MKISEYISKLKQAHDVPNHYCNKFPKNCGYFDGISYSWDCWNLIKTILASPGWEDTRVAGSYVSPKNFITGDCDGYHLLMQCTDRSKDFSHLKVGAYLYIGDRGHEHAGAYIGDFVLDGYTFNVVECTSDWQSRVQYTYVDDKGRRFLYKGGPQGRSWTDNGILPYIEYEEEPAPVCPTAYGIDVSRYQKGFDLNCAKAEGFTYAILKAGGADGNPKYYKDPSFEDFYAQAKADKMYIGAYYFGNAFSTEDAIKEASYFCQYLQGKDIVHVYYDVEGAMLNQGHTHLTEIIKTFCQVMINAGYACGVYTSESHFNSRFDDSQLVMFPHWVARYSSTAPKLKSIALVEIWQFGGSTNYIRSAKINGTTVDQDQINIPWTDSGSQPKQTYVIPETTKKSVEQLAIEVLAGLWGNGIVRKARLTVAGYDYRSVQERVNQVAEQRKGTKTYIVKKGDTLSSIAKRYNTTVDALVKANSIPNKNRIFVDQELIIV